jgi:hypothetical protein
MRLEQQLLWQRAWRLGAVSRSLSVFVNEEGVGKQVVYAVVVCARCLVKGCIDVNAGLSGVGVSSDDTFWVSHNLLPDVHMSKK